MAVINSTTDISFSSLTAGLTFRNIGFAATGRTGGGVLTGLPILEWVQATNSAANASAGVVDVSSLLASNCFFQHNAATYGYVLRYSSSAYGHNVRIDKSTVTATAGNRNGIEYQTGASFASAFDRICVRGHPGAGVAYTGTSTTARMLIRNSVIDGCGDGFKIPAAIVNTVPHQVSQSMVTNNTGTGLLATSGSGMIFSLGNRLRNNGTNMTSVKLSANDYTTAGTDAAEYADVATGDYRIVAGSTPALNGYGVSVKAASGGGSGRYGA